MDYQKIYNDLCFSRQKLRGSSKRLRKNEGDFTYYERHHIIPRSMGGSNEPENMVLLTHREHIIAHRLLHVIYPEDSGMALALTLMLQLSVAQDEHGKRVISGNELSTKEAEEVRRLYSQAASGENNPRYGVVVSEETKEKIRQKALLNNKGEKNPRYGAKLSEETKDKIRQKALGRKLSDETKRKIGDSQRGEKNHWFGKHLPEEVKRKMRKPKSEETKKKLSEAAKNRPPMSKETKEKITKAMKERPLPEGFKNQWSKHTKKVINGEGKVFNSRKEAAEFYKVNVNTIKNWIKSGKNGFKDLK